MMATYRTPSDSEALGPAVRILMKRVRSDPALSAASQKVMSWLLLEGRDEAPSAPDMARFVGLTERSVRRVYRELKETGWLDPERGWSETPKADTPERQAVLDGVPERTEMSATLDLPSFREHIAMLEVIRDRALAKGDDRTALSAQTRIGRALGFDRPRADKNVRASFLLPRRQAGEAGRGFDASPAVDAVDQPPPNLPHTPARGRDQKEADKNVRAEALPRRQPGEGLGGGGEAFAPSSRTSPPPPRPSPKLTLEGGRRELAESGSELDMDGSPLAKTGSNWLELADLGRPEIAGRPEKLNPISHLLEKPIFATEKDWLATRDEPSRRPYWLNGVSPAALLHSPRSALPADRNVRGA